MNIAERMREVVKAAEPHYDDYTFEGDDECWTSYSAIVTVNMTEHMNDRFRDYDRVQEAALKHIKDAFPRAVWVQFKSDKMPKTGTVCHVISKSSGLWFEVEVYNVTKMRQAMDRDKAARAKAKAKKKAA